MYTKYTYDETYFETIDTTEKAYFLGFLYADGTNTGVSLQLALMEEDSYILERLKNAIKYTGPLRTYSHKIGKPQTRLEIVRLKLVADIEKLGVRRNKTFNLQFPDFLPEDLIPHFIRGYFDGDGCITKDNRSFTITFTGFIDMLRVVEKHLLQIMVTITKGSYAKRHKEKNDGIYTIYFGTNLSTLMFFNYVYKNADGLFLTRKFFKFENLFKQLDVADYSIGRNKNKKEIMNSNLEKAKILYLEQSDILRKNKGHGENF